MLNFSILTNPGDREVNEDSVASIEIDGNYCFVLCDGLGGHGKGDEASCLVANSVIDCFKKDSLNKEFITMSITDAQNALKDEQKKQCVRSQMKTTIVVLTIVNGYAQWGHVGDSRLYYFKNDKLKNRTKDHSVPQMLATAHRIKEEEIRFHPDRNRLLNVLGSDDDDLKIDISKRIKIKDNKMSFILCSDGFWELVSEGEMIEIISDKSMPCEKKINQLKDIAFENGNDKNKDNMSLILITF